MPLVLHMWSISFAVTLSHITAVLSNLSVSSLHFPASPTDAEGRIVMVRSNGLIVFVPKYGIEGPVYLVPKEPPKGKAAAVAAANKLDGNAPSSDWVVDEKSQTVESKDGKRRFKVLDTVTVHIEVIEPQPNRPKLSLTLVSQ
ncbi:unnamed protein product [Closterium sp. NIES-53]